MKRKDLEKLFKADVKATLKYAEYANKREDWSDDAKYPDQMLDELKTLTLDDKDVKIVYTSYSHPEYNCDAITFRYKNKDLCIGDCKDVERYFELYSAPLPEDDDLCDKVIEEENEDDH